MENHVQINSHTCRWLGRLQWLHTGNGGWIDGKVFDFCSNTEPHHTALLYATFDRLLWLLLTFSCLLKLLWFLRNSVCLEGLLQRYSYCVTPALRGSTCGPKAWPEWRGLGFLRMDYIEACSNQRGSGMTKTSSAPPHVPAPLVLVPFHARRLVFRKTRLPVWWSNEWEEEEGDGIDRKRQTERDR